MVTIQSMATRHGRGRPEVILSTGFLERRGSAGSAVSGVSTVSTMPR